MAKLGLIVPHSLDKRLSQYIPWGSKGAVITELLYDLADRAEQDNGKCVYDLIKRAATRAPI